MGNWVNGDDLLYGGKGDDKLVGATGDRFIMTAGTDTVFGDKGRHGPVRPAGRRDHQADLSGRAAGGSGHGHFSADTKFTVTPTRRWPACGVLQALDSTGAVIATTNFSGIELVRALETIARLRSI